MNHPYTVPSSIVDKVRKGHGTDFQKACWLAMCTIKRGETITYTELARRAGKPDAVRAAAAACAANPYAPDVPCHRVVRKDQKLCGYTGPGGVPRKIELLREEGATMPYL